MDLSIIIPIYNTSIEVLKRCLNSIKFDNRYKYEIILLNDGSDESLTKEYKKCANEKIKVINKINTGVSSTRNFGINLAKGKYILFVDSDDILYCDKINLNLLKKDYDMIFYNFTIINSKNHSQIYKEIENKESGLINSKQILDEFIENDKFYCPFAKFIKRDFLKNNKILFNEKMINGEDAIFNLDIISKNPKIYYVNLSMYGYFYTSNNYDKRIKNKFDSTLDDYLYKYNRKKELVDINDIVTRKIENKAVEQIFRIAMICSSLKMTRKKELANYLDKFNINTLFLSKINLFKYKQIINKKWFFIHFMSLTRKLYLKIKRGD